MKKDFLYFFVDAQGRSYYEKPDGSIGVTNIKTPVSDTPEGWQDSAIQYGRSFRFPGMIRSFTVPLKGYLDSSKILKYLMYAIGGIEVICNLIVEKLNRDTGEHDGYYLGEMDFSQFSDEDNGAVINVMQGGLSKLIKSNENTTYEIPLNVPEAIVINFDGIELISDVTLLNYKDYIQSGDIETPNARSGEFINIGIIMTPSETQYPSLLWNGNTQYQSNDGNDFPDQWLAKATADTQLILKSGIIEFNVAGSDQVILMWYCKNDITGAERYIGIDSIVSGGGLEHHILFMEGTFNFLANERIWLIVRNVGGSPSKVISFAWEPLNDPNGLHEINLTYNYRKPASDVKALRASYVFNQLIKKISNGKYSGAGSILLGEANDYVLTSGDGLRGFEKAVIKTSINDFIDSYNTRFNIGFGDENNMGTIEEKQYFFNDTAGFNLGEVNDFQCAPAIDHIFNEIKIGWPNQNYSDVNGRNEFNTTWQWTTPIKRIPKVLDLQSKYRADPYGAEFTRINLTNKTTTDSTSDNDVFIINIESTADPITNKFNLNRPAFDSILGIISPSTIFNILLSPKRCLYAHGNYLRVGLHYHEAEYIISQTADKNQDLVTTISGTTISEKSNVLIGSLAGPLFKPYTFTFSTQVPENLVNLMTTDKYKKIPFTWKGVSLSGYILECSQVSNLNPSQTFKLLCASDVDITKLINVM